jgi:uncharacterized membrane protein
VEQLLHQAAHYIALGIEVVAITIITWGAVEAVIGILRVMSGRETKSEDRRHVWLAFARWLVAGLTFQLAADLVNTSFNPTWDELGRLAVIAAIRTFLSFFLDRELADTRELQEAGRKQP